MKVRLIPLGCKISNLALMKLSAFHKDRGDEVSLDEPEPDLVVWVVQFERVFNDQLNCPSQKSVCLERISRMGKVYNASEHINICLER